jgi:hypothetical protein
MLYRPLILQTLVLIALLSCNHSRSQTIPTLVVTPRHEHNFEILKSWMQSDRVFATKTELQSAMENAFRAAQQNDPTPLTSAGSANFKTNFSSYQTLISSAC